MKKLVVLMLVVGMASLASAAFTLSSASGVAGNTVTLDVGAALGDNQRDFLTMIGVSDSTSISLTGATGGPAGVIANGTPLVINVYGTIEAYAPNGEQELGAQVVMSDGSANLYAAGVIGILDIAIAGSAAPGVYDVIIQVMGVGTNIVGTVTVVPEPMTMALLGLGGLFLRRKK